MASSLTVMQGTGELYCPRCDASVGVIRVWHGWRWCWRIWFAGAVALFAMTPLLAWDFCVVIPSMMLYVAAGGPLYHLSRTKPVCRKCSLELVEGQLTGTPMKRVKARV